MNNSFRQELLCKDMFLARRGRYEVPAYYHITVCFELRFVDAKLKLNVVSRACSMEISKVNLKGANMHRA